MPFLQLRVLTRYPEFAEEILLAHGAVSVTFRDAADTPVLEPAPGQTPLWPQTEALGLFPADADPEAVADELRRTLPDGATLAAASGPVDDEDWVRAWQEHCPPLKFGTRLWVCPREKAVREPGTVTVILDPGLAFGTGTHPSTALCLDWLARADLGGRTVLDYGCGSGLLGIAAIKLGARHADFVDIDPQALTATRSNAAENGVEGRITVTAAEGFRPQAHDVVVANILANPLISLAPLLSSCVSRGGDLVLAGLLERQVDDVLDAYHGRFVLETTALREGWVRLHCRRTAGE